MSLDFLYYVTSALFFFVFIERLLVYIYLWEKKEYNPSRVVAHILGTEQGRHLFSSPIAIIRALLIGYYFVTIFDGPVVSLYGSAVFLYFVINLFELIAKKLREKDWQKPTISAKNLSIGILSIVLILSFYFIPLIDRFFWLIFVNSLTFIVVSFFVLLFGLRTDFIRDATINKAVAIRKRRKNLFMIAIYGSYGKSSIKELLLFLLQNSFSSFKNHMFQTDFYGISKTLLNKKFSKKELFVAEVSTYSLGEMIELSSLFSPSVIVISGIDEKGSAFYFSKTNLFTAYKKLISQTPNNVPIYICFDKQGEKLAEVFSKTKKTIITYGESKKSTIYPTTIKLNKFSTEFALTMNGRRLGFFKLKQIGKQAILNAIPSIGIGIGRKINLSKIKKVLYEIPPFASRMQPLLTPLGTVYIDDTKGLSPSGIEEALRYLSLYKKRRILVLEPLIELGRESSAVHERLGLLAGKICDTIYLTNHNFYSDFERGARNSSKRVILSVLDPERIAKKLENLKKGDIVLFEGEKAKTALSFLSADSYY